MTPIQGIIKKVQTVELEHRGQVTVKPADHIATGGEGSLYRLSANTVLKIYTDPKKMQRDGMPDKITLLSGIKHPFIVSPKGLVFLAGKPIGFYMQFETGEPIARVFTTAYRQRERFGDKDAASLVDGMRETIIEAHRSKALLVDANEFNWLVSRTKNKIEPRVIDVDSWAIGKWKPSVIMPSIRDWQTKGFNEGTDWFSFGIVSFQVFTGIHPYKGMLAGYQPNEMEKRMKDKKSVFASGVRLNSAVRDLNLIPNALRAWYRDVFEGDERSVPPTTKEIRVQTPKIALVQRTVIVGGTEMLVFDMRYDGVNERPVKIHPAGVIELASGKLVSLKTGKVIATKTKDHCEIINTQWGLLIAQWSRVDTTFDFSMVLTDGTVTPVKSMITGNRLFRYYNRMFAIADAGMTEILVKHFGKEPLLVAGSIWQIMANSTTWFDGLGIQDTLGTPYFLLPFGDDSCAYVRIPELVNQKVVNAKAGMRFVAAVTLDTKSGQYNRHEFVFDKTYSSYKVTVTPQVTSELNAVMLQKGVCVSIPDDGELRLTVPTQDQDRIVADHRIKAAMLLEYVDATVMYIENSKVWSVRLK